MFAAQTVEIHVVFWGRVGYEYVHARGNSIPPRILTSRILERKLRSSTSWNLRRSMNSQLPVSMGGKCECGA